MNLNGLDDEVCIVHFKGFGNESEWI